MERLVKSVQVTIVFSSQGAGCEGQCGIDWSSTEMVGMVKQRIGERFGEAVKLELVDLSSDSSRAIDLKKRIVNESVSLPLLLIGNEVRIPGEFDIRQLLDAIEVEQELNGTAI
jgi:glutaredoxin